MPRCETCKHYEPDSMTCRKNPPVVIAAGEAKTSGLTIGKAKIVGIGGWPSVNQAEWCSMQEETSE